MVLPPFTARPYRGTHHRKQQYGRVLYVVAWVTRPSGSVTVVVVSSDSFEVYCRVRRTGPGATLPSGLGCPCRLAAA